MLDRVPESGVNEGMPMQIAPGLYRIGADIVNSYLIVDGHDVTLIDAALPGYWKLLLLAELASIGKSIDNVRALVLTHGDTDHIGFAARLYQEKGIAAYVHPADVERAQLKVKKTWVLPGHGPAWDGGVPEGVRLIREAAATAKPTH